MRKQIVLDPNTNYILLGLLIGGGGHRYAAEWQAKVMSPLDEPRPILF